jgi:NADH dehydrogenase
MPNRIFITGGAGFVGSATIDALVAHDLAVNALVNRKPLAKHAGDVKSIPGDLFDDASLDAAMAGCDGVIHLVGIIKEIPAKGISFEKIHFEGTKKVVDAAVRNKIQRYIQMSALGTRAGAVSDYHKTKWKAEEYVRGSALDWTIFRPGMIHGAGGELMQMEAQWAKGKAAPFLFMPYFGAGLFGAGGAGMLQPVYVDDVARAFVEALKNTRSIHQTYDLVGSEKITWPDLHRAVAKAITGKKRLTIPIPAWKAKLLAAIVPAKLLPFNRDQVIMSQEDNTADASKFIKDFGWTPADFSPTFAGYASKM